MAEHREIEMSRIPVCRVEELPEGESCVLTQKCNVGWSGGNNLKCESKVTCTQAYGTGANGLSSCNTSVSW